MAIEVKEVPLSGDLLPYTWFPLLRCDACGDGISDHGLAMAMWLETSPHIVIYAHKGFCLEKVERTEPRTAWLTDELQDHFFELLTDMGFPQSDGKIALRNPNEGFTSLDTED